MLTSWPAWLHEPGIAGALRRDELVGLVGQREERERAGSGQRSCPDLALGIEAALGKGA